MTTTQSDFYLKLIAYVHDQLVTIFKVMLAIMDGWTDRLTDGHDDAGRPLRA